MLTWGKAAAILVAVWLCAGAVILYTRAQRPTAESFVRYLEENKLDGLDPARRAAVITGVTDRLNRLDFEQREQLRLMRRDRTFFQQLTPEERRTFLEATLPEGFRQLMQALNKMTPEERRKIARRALDDLERDNEGIPPRVDKADAQKVIEQGLGAFYEEASAEVKLDFAPVLERLQRNLQGLR